MNAQYNAIYYAQQLEAAGVPKTQAELHAKALELAVSRCTDVHDMKTELSYSIAGLETMLRAEISKTATTLRAEMHDMEARLRTEIHDLESRLRVEMHDIEAKLLSRIETLESSLRSEMNFLKWMNGLTLALVVGQYVRSWLA